VAVYQVFASEAGYRSVGSAPLRWHQAGKTIHVKVLRRGIKNKIGLEIEGNPAIGERLTNNLLAMRHAVENQATHLHA
jgi:hypothetical protein